jgi:hypothetical protein
VLFPQANVPLNGFAGPKVDDAPPLGPNVERLRRLIEVKEFLYRLGHNASDGYQESQSREWIAAVGAHSPAGAQPHGNAARAFGEGDADEWPPALSLWPRVPRLLRIRRIIAGAKSEQ